MSVVNKPANFYRKLETFLTEKTVADINRETYLICDLEDLTNKISVSLVFMRECENIECGSFENCIIEKKGAVFVFPCYWLCVPKELAFTYLTSIIDAFYDESVSEWINSSIAGGSINGSNGNTNINGCPCCN